MNSQLKNLEPKKEMLSQSLLENGKKKVRINYSSLNLINTCPRKADLILNQGLQSSFKSEALVFGSAFHKALEHWYTLPISLREPNSTMLKEMDAVIFNPPNEPLEGAMESVRQFALTGDILRHLPDGDKRGLDNALKLLKAYFKLYQNDGWEVYRDALGEPMIEKDVSFIIYEDENLVIEYFGRVDLILKQTQTGVIAVTDHKTTATLGSQFYDRLKPNHQYTGYVLGAQKALGIDTNKFLINGIQTAKTKQEFARQVTERTEEDFQELREAVIETVFRWLKMEERGFYPQNTPEPCGSYGACQFLELCRASKELKPIIKKNLGEGYNNG